MAFEWPAQGIVTTVFGHTEGRWHPGIDIVGTMPPAISPPTVVTGFVSSHAKDAAAAKQLLTYLSSPEADATYRASKMQPGR